MTLDVVIRNARVIDGTGAPWFPASVGIANGCIAAISRGDPLPAGVLDFDVHGHYLTPGFIDIHRHSDWTLLVGPSAESALEQGLTTEVIGNCGYGPAPAVDRKRVEQNILAHSADDGVEIDWTSFGEFLDRLDHDLAVTVVPLVAHGPIRTSVMGVSDREARPEEVARMCYWVDEALDSGAFGISTGLEYPPYRTASTTEEITALCARVGAKGRLYATHVRERWFEIVPAVTEAVAIARASGARLHISHITARALARHLTEPLLTICEDARNTGLSVSFDTYPYEWALGPGYELLPPWAVAGPLEQFVQRFSDLDFRRRVEAAHAENLVRWVQLGQWDKIRIVSAPNSQDAVGRTVAELARDSGRSPWDVVFDLFAAAGDLYPNIVQITQTLDWEDLLLTVSDPSCSLGSDAVTLARQGPLQDRSLHPGSYGFVPRVLDEFVMSRHVLSFEEAVRRITSLPAGQLGLWDRGLIRPGCTADLVVIDPERVCDNTSWTDFNARPSGFDYVLVNGKLAVENGRATGVRGGGVLRCLAHA